jgi:hypothetical protein
MGEVRWVVTEVKGTEELEKENGTVWNDADGHWDPLRQCGQRRIHTNGGGETGGSRVADLVVAKAEREPHRTPTKNQRTRMGKGEVVGTDICSEQRTCMTHFGCGVELVVVGESLGVMLGCRISDGWDGCGW